MKINVAHQDVYVKIYGSRFFFLEIYLNVNCLEKMKIGIYNLNTKFI